MGERVAVQIPLSAIDAFATRSRQQAQAKRWRQQEQEQHGVQGACLAAAADDHDVEGVRGEDKRARDHAPAADIGSSNDAHRSLEGPWTSIGTTRDGKTLEHIAEVSGVVGFMQHGDEECITSVKRKADVNLVGSSECGSLGKPRREVVL